MAMCNTPALSKFTGFYNRSGKSRVNAPTEAPSVELLELLLPVMAV